PASRSSHGRFLWALPLDAAKQSLGVTCAVRRGQMLPESVTGITRLLTSARGGGVSPQLFPSSFAGKRRISFFPQRDRQGCWASAPRVPGEPPRRTPPPPRSHGYFALPPLGPVLSAGAGFRLGARLAEAANAGRTRPGAERPLRYGAPPSRDEQPSWHVRPANSRGI
ncbi:uncharacterized protein Tco025E_02407, partial [Trypanosoma conorhini]